MSCAFKIPLVIKGVRHLVPCGQCMSCRLSYQSHVLFAVEHEVQYAYRSGKGCSFLTLTYDDHSVPLAGSDASRPRSDSLTAALLLAGARETLVKRDVQLFNKRLRISLDRKLPGAKYKYVFAGEYGDKFNRPHYHALLIGLSDVEIASTVRLAWPYGLPQVGALRPGGTRYVLKYITSAPRGLTAKAMFDDVGIERPFLLRSRGMAYQFLFDNLQYLSDNDMTYMRMGKRVRIPPYYQRLLSPVKLGPDPITNARLKAEAAEYGLDVYKYSHLKALNVEESLIASARANGTPVDDYNYLHERVSASSSFDRSLVDSDDIIPF